MPEYYAEGEHKLAPVEINDMIFEARGPNDCKGVSQPGFPLSKIMEMFPDASYAEEITEKGWYHKDKLETDEETYARARAVLKAMKEKAAQVL